MTKPITLSLRVGALTLALAAFYAGGITHAAAQEKIVQPNEHLTVEGIPPITEALAKRAALYNDFRPRAIVDWHPTKREMLVAVRTKGSTTQIHLLKKPLGELEQLTDFSDPVKNARYEPKNGAYFVFEKDESGTEANQLYRFDFDTRKVTLLTDPKEKHAMGEWNRAGTRMVMSSTQLDKTAGAGRRTDVTTDVYILDPLRPEEKKKIASLPGGGWGAFKWSADDGKLAAMNYKSANESHIWLIDIATGERRHVLPPTDKPDAPVSYRDLHFSRDGKHLFVTSDGDDEFQQLVKVELAGMKQTILSKHIPWDIEYIEPSKHNDLLAVAVNNDGLTELHMFDGATNRELARPKLPLGDISRIKWRSGDELAIDLNSAYSPGEVYTLNVKTGKVEQWTAPKSELDTSKFSETSIIRWKSFDQRTISGLITKPGPQFKGPRPVVVLIHGGPEAQATIGFLGRYNYLVNELGVTLIQPNVRGSKGYGKTFLKLDNGYQREDSVKDIGALFDWIAKQPDLDSKRVMVMGGSYGGYMSLAVSTHYADRIVGAIDVVGISNFITFLERTETYRRDLRRVEYGDERDPKMHEFLTRISPLNNAEKIKKPLFVVQGKNDPRVPLFEAEQIVARVRKNNTPVWYLMADNEGHGFARKPNADYYFFSVVRFVEEYLLK
ncbi:MAG TPA: prolyl oligopeptidase family serine peptidase [Paucimonas sp.]|nr:prolyl oligopeptidase family serine peptidase [Paucimonas sp.]